MYQFKAVPRAVAACGRMAMVFSLALAAFACGGGGGGNNTPDAGGGGGTVELLDQVGCHMLGDFDDPVAVPPSDPSTPLACIEKPAGSSACLVHNERLGSCLGANTVFFEWEAGTFYNVKAFGWTVESSSHGEVKGLGETDADSGILAIPPSTTVTASITHTDGNGVTYQVVFRMEDDYVVFEQVDPPGGW